MSGFLVEKYLPLLQAVVKVKNVRCRQMILKELGKDKQFATCLREITENLLDGNVDLSVKDKRRLNRHAKVIKSLQKGKGVSQSGGFLNIVIPLLATVVGELIASAAKK